MKQLYMLTINVYIQNLAFNLVYIIKLYKYMYIYPYDLKVLNIDLVVIIK